MGIPLLAAAASPIVKALMEKGLNVLASAVAAKGKEFVENKLGVELKDDMTPEQAAELKALEIDRERDIRAWALEDKKLDLEGFKEEVKDKGSARLRDQAMMALGRHNWRADIMFVLAVCMIAALVWLIWKDQTINEYVKGIFTLVLGRFLGYLDNIYNFEFGTTRGSQGKDGTIAVLSGAKPDRRG